MRHGNNIGEQALDERAAVEAVREMIEEAIELLDRLLEK